ncbi:SDR family oxidoreductase [Rubinisphaera sp.]|uniref:SDR family NAD(P)-dependent oxidoreductase n=1 Tax=Rubinisphaera sp. TaxID=2024857 RepID=UPI000C0F2061|nr:SDR family oxidoreductase [Rubinisphaera sp.]MBV09762.1 hypothetical protein [Rubinisphaera sp.]HCS52359.1 hypothetical protein [Planctomycetaceae bacterium]
MIPNRVVIVTGAASGIGLATAQLLADVNWLVVSCDLQPAHESIHEIDNWKEHLLVDVRSVEHLEKLVDTAATYGPIEALVNNAGVNHVADITDVSEEDWDRVLDTNLKAAFFASRYVVPYFRKQGKGSIVNIASNAGLLPRAHDPVYSISKMSLVGLTKSLALCLSRDNIRVNCICPGPVSETGIINADLAAAADPDATAQSFINASPLAAAQGRMIHPKEVAANVSYLLSEAAAMVTGTSIAIDGGKSLGVPPK